MNELLHILEHVIWALLSFEQWYGRGIWIKRARGFLRWEPRDGANLCWGGYYGKVYSLWVIYAVERVVVLGKEAGVWDMRGIWLRDGVRTCRG